MSTGAILALVATLLTVEDGTARIDKGLINGIRTGDRGQLYYTLMVGSVKRRIDVVTVEVVGIEERAAIITAPRTRDLRPGSRVAFEIQQTRLAPAEIVAAARQFLGEEVAARLARELLDELIPASAELVESSVEATPETTDMIFVSGGDYWIGADIEAAGFYNEQPRFLKQVAPFWIDSLPARGDHATGSGDEAFVANRSYADAEGYCSSQGKRLPDEFEWEIAAQLFDFLTGGPPLEWTGSWYLPYPGNSRPEREYGKRYRVIRGSLDPTHQNFKQRRFLLPEETNPKVGFRCARTASR